MHRKEGIERELPKRRRVHGLYRRRNSVSGLLCDEKEARGQWIGDWVSPL